MLKGWIHQYTKVFVPVKHPCHWLTNLQIMLARLVSLQCAEEHVYTLLGNNNSKPCYDPCTPMYGIHTSPHRAVGNYLHLVGHHLASMISHFFFLSIQFCNFAKFIFDSLLTNWFLSKWLSSHEQVILSLKQPALHICISMAFLTAIFTSWS